MDLPTFGYDYRVVSFFKRYLTAKGICLWNYRVATLSKYSKLYQESLPSLTSEDNSNMPKFKN